jgi:hypothetical protein
LLLGVGVKTLMEARANPAPQEITYAQFSQTSPSSGWYHVSGCRLDLSNAVVEEQNNVPVRAFVPVFDVRNPQQRTTHIFADMDDRKTLVLFLDQEEQQRYHSKQEQQLWQTAHRSEFTVNRDVAGLTRKGVRYLRDLSNEFAPVADADPDALVVLSADWKPNPTLAAIELSSGALLGLILGFFILRDRQQRSS